MKLLRLGSRFHENDGVGVFCEGDYCFCARDPSASLRMTAVGWGKMKRRIYTLCKSQFLWLWWVVWVKIVENLEICCNFDIFVYIPFLIALSHGVACAFFGADSYRGMVSSSLRQGQLSSLCGLRDLLVASFWFLVKYSAFGRGFF